MLKEMNKKKLQVLAFILAGHQRRKKDRPSLKRNWKPSLQAGGKKEPGFAFLVDICTGKQQAVDTG